MNFLETITLEAVGQWGLVAVVIVALVKIWPAMRRVEMESDTTLRADLMEALKRERQHTDDMLKQEREHCEARIRALERAYTSQIEQLKQDQRTMRQELALARGVPVETVAALQQESEG